MENWIDILSEPAIALASHVWKKGKAETWGILSRAIQAEDLSQHMPLEQFRQYIKLIADPAFFIHCPVCKTRTSVTDITCSNCLVNLDIARNSFIEKEFGSILPETPTPPKEINPPTQPKQSTQKPLATILLWLSKFISIVGGILATLYSLYVVGLLFGWVNAFVALLIFPITYILLPFYILFMYGDPTLLIANYGVGIVATLLSFIALRLQTPATPSPSHKKITLSAVVGWVVFCFFALIAYGWVKDVYIMPLLYSIPTPTKTPLLLRPNPTQQPQQTSTPNTSISLAFPECYHWSEITTSMKGRQVCVFGIVESTYPTNETSTRINFTDTPNSFFVFDVNFIYPDIEPGWCVLVNGKVELAQNIPFIKITEGMSGGFPPKQSDCQ